MRLPQPVTVPPGTTLALTKAIRIGPVLSMGVTCRFGSGGGDGAAICFPHPASTSAVNAHAPDLFAKRLFITPARDHGENGIPPEARVTVREAAEVERRIFRGRDDLHVRAGGAEADALPLVPHHWPTHHVGGTGVRTRTREGVRRVMPDP